MTRLLLGFTVSLGLLSCANAQSFINDPAAGIIPPALQPGSPSGSYSLNDFEDVNLYAGKLNIAIPLLRIGGRGEAGYTLMARPVPTTFTVQVESSFLANTGPSSNLDQWTFNSSIHTDWTSMSPGYGAGLMLLKPINNGPLVHCLNSPSPPGDPGFDVWSVSYTHLVFVRPDGTETKFYSTSTSAVATFNACNAGTDRGTKFLATDGSGAMFIASASVVDTYRFDTSFSGYGTISGSLYLKNGTVYSINLSRVTKIKDRNGNFTTFTFLPDTNLPSEIDDSDGRQVLITYDQAIPNSVDRSDTITYHGFGGASRTIQVLRRPLSGRLRPDLIPAGSPPLFEAGHSVTWAEPNVISHIDLPNLRFYDFYYTRYNEIARIVLPTGAAVDYDHGSGVNTSNLPANVSAELFASGQILTHISPDNASNFVPAGNPPPQPNWQPIIYRRLLGRSLYLAGPPSSGQTADLTTSYSRLDAVTGITIQTLGSGTYIRKTAVLNSANYDGSNDDGYVEVRQTGPSLPVPVVERHYFYTFSIGTHVRAFGPAFEMVQASYVLYIVPTLTPLLGKEYRTTSPGLADLTRIFTTFSDGGSASCAEQRQFLDGNSNPKSRKYFTYDGYGNQSQIYESDYGQGAALTVQGPTVSTPATCPALPQIVAAPSPVQFLRKTTFAYKTDAAYVADDVRMISLPQSQTVSDGRGNILSNITYAYDGVTPSPDRGAVTGWETVNTRPRGNLTSTTRQVIRLEGSDATGQADVVTQNRYDTLGSLTQEIDARGNITDYSYASPLFAFVSEVDKPSVNGVRSSVQYPLYDTNLGKPTKIQDAAGTQSTARYDDLLDRLTEVVRGTNLDASLQSRVHYVYNDSPGALAVQTEVDQFAYLDARMKSEIRYDALGRESLRCTGGLCGTAAIEEQKQFDILDRRTGVSNPGTGAPGALTTTSYDGLSRAISVCPPDQSCSSASYQGNTVTNTDAGSKQQKRILDALGRIIEVDEAPNNAAVNYKTMYAYDGLNNLIAVTQMGTSGATTVTRSFDYDSLKRLRETRNPESGTIKYAYDANGNLASKISGRVTADDYGVCYGTWQTVGSSLQCNPDYDGLNRAGRKWDSNGNLLARYCYDGLTLHNVNQFPPYNDGNCTGTAVAPAIGRLTASGNSVSSTAYTYDQLGRVATSQQLPAGQTNPYTFAYSYYLNGQMSGMQYPSMRREAMCWDELGRARWTKNIAAATAFPASCDGANPAVAQGEGLRGQVEVYEPQGAVTKMLLGNTLRERWCYNSRLQPSALHFGPQTTIPCTQEVAGDQLWFQWGYTSTAQAGNNGNVQFQRMWYPNTSAGIVLRQDYTYDDINRLAGVAEVIERGSGTTWGLGWNYDYAGNLRLSSASGMTPNISTPLNFGQYGTSGTSLSNRLVWNRWDSTAQQGADAISYDLSGHMLSRSGAGGIVESYGWDGDDHMTSFQNGNILTRYAYDGEGRRVQKIEPVRTTTYVYDASGNLASEYGGMPAVNGTTYITADHLGSTRLVTDAVGGVVERIDYEPFGEELLALSGSPRLGISGFVVSTPSGTQRFAGKERDAESGLDNFGARYFSGVRGRFTSPDWSNVLQPVPFANLSDPQTLNLYSYGRNNPLRFVDTDGHSWWSNFKERLANSFAYGDAVTDAELPELFARQRQWLIQNVANNGAQVSVLQNASDTDINNLYGQWRTAIRKAQGPETWIPIEQWQRAEDGALAPIVYRGGKLSASPNDVKVDSKTGLVKTTHGPSLHVDPAKVAAHGDPHQIMSHPPELQIIQRGKDPGHFEITPRQPMTMTYFLELLNQVSTQPLIP